MNPVSFKNSLELSIKSSLVIAVIVLLALLGGVSLMAKMRLDALEQTIESVGRERMPRIRALGEINLMISRMRLSSVRAALTNTPEQRDAATKLLADRSTKLDEMIAAFQREVRESPEQALLFSQFVAKWRGYQKYQAMILEVGRSGDAEAIGRVINVDSFEPFQHAVDAISDGILFANQQADRAIDEAKASSASFGHVLWGANILSVLVALIALNFVIRDVSLPIRRITESMERISKGELDTAIPFAERGNELGMMARALAVFRKSLAENERLGAATRTLSELSEWLQSAKSEAELYDMIGDVLGRLMPECRGTLYIYANSRDLLESVKAWNGGHDKASMHPDDCWGLRRGHTYVHGVSEIEFHCGHVEHGASASENYCCIPILAHGEMVGLLHFDYIATAGETAEEAKTRFADRQRLGMAAAEHISIAIANAKMREELRDQSVRDVLTGLNNRRYLLETGRRELKRAARESEPLSLLSIDVDHFKSFNDNHGHDAGDIVLRQVGECMREIFAEHVPCRYGGEEFVVLMPGTGSLDAVAQAEVFRARVEGLVIRYAESNLPRVTVSVGVASYPSSGESLAELLKVADQGLYEAKRGGRNRIVCAAVSETAPVEPGDLAARLRAATCCPTHAAGNFAAEDCKPEEAAKAA